MLHPKPVFDRLNESMNIARSTPALVSHSSGVIHSFDIPQIKGCRNFWIKNLWSTCVVWEFVDLFVRSLQLLLRHLDVSKLLRFLVTYLLIVHSVGLWESAWIRTPTQLILILVYPEKVLIHLRGGLVRVFGAFLDFVVKRGIAELRVCQLFNSGSRFIT